MLLFLMVITVAFFVGLQRYSEKAERILMAVIFSGMSGSVYLLIMMFLVTPFFASEIRYAESGKAEIVSLRNFLKLEGDFFLLFGSIDSVPHYAYYYRTSRGGLKLEVLPAKNAEVFEEKRSDAFINKVSKEIYHPGLKEWEWLFIPYFLNHCSSDSGYAFHVPEGSVKKDISLDLRRLKP